MPTSNKGSFVWYEYLTGDVKGAIGFYGEVVGWTTQPFGQDYTMWVGSQGPLGGVMRFDEAGAPFWTAHVQVEDVDAATALATARGGKILRQPTDIPTVGRFAVIADPQGAAICIFRPNEEMALHDLARDGEFCWNELMTSDSAAAAKFYADLFGWKVLEEMDMGPMGKYRIFGVGDRRLGGMMDAPAGVRRPPAWLFYASTGDLDAALKRATAKGAKVVNGPMEVPGGGRIAQLTDPQGAAFALHQAPPGK